MKAYAYMYYTGCQDDLRGGNSSPNGFWANDLARTADTTYNIPVYSG